ncbi:MAG: ABC transporter permease [Verrucomicrobia bacterium]|nr:ABC transporter permease [Verrucomicrobiota bacterium]
MSPLPSELFLALRYLRPRRTFVSVITVISTLGAMLGVAVLIIVIAVMSGFDREWRERILGCNAHLKIAIPNAVMREYAGLLSLLSTNPAVRGAAPFVLEQVLMVGKPIVGSDAPIRGPVLRGVDPDLESKISVLPSSLIQGEFDLNGRGLVVGSEIAREMELSVGDHVTIYSPNSIRRMEKSLRDGKKEADLGADYEVRGVFDVGFNDFNAMMVVTSLENGQYLYNLDNGIHGIFVMLKDPFQADAMRESLRPLVSSDLAITTWKEDNAQLFGALATEKTMMYVILFVVFIIAAFAIVNSEITFAVSKFKDIGLLKALGASNAYVMRIFLGHSMAVGVLGVGLGYALGRLFLHHINDILNLVRSMTGFDMLPAAIYQIRELPYEVLPLDVAIICGGGFLICTAAGLLPAWLAARLDPVEALRHE